MQVLSFQSAILVGTPENAHLVGFCSGIKNQISKLLARLLSKTPEGQAVSNTPLDLDLGAA
ncbi:MAG: hypothetical protein L0338_25365, partial [Acidobacteria bacterium]|nr:hypothetical protein [Acidobacteriota bacterium]